MSDGISAVMTGAKRYSSDEDVTCHSAQQSSEVSAGQSVPSKSVHQQRSLSSDQSDPVLQGTSLILEQPLTKLPSDLQCTWQNAYMFSESTAAEPRLGHFANKNDGNRRDIAHNEYDRNGGAGGAGPDYADGAGARGASQWGAARVPARMDMSDGCGSGIMVTSQGGVSVAMGPGVSVQGEIGVVVALDDVVRSSGIVATFSKLPTTCKNSDGKPVPCTQGLNMTAFGGFDVQHVKDVCKLTGTGTTVSVSGIPGTSPLSPSVTFTEDGEVNTAGAALGIGAGAGINAVQTETQMLRFSDVPAFIDWIMD